MSEKLTIDNFAGIAFIELEINRINLLIGSQATGKSICAKLLYFFKSFYKELFVAIRDQEPKREFDKRLLGKFCQYFPPGSWGAGSFLIRYAISEVYIEIVNQDDNNLKIEIIYSPVLKQIFSKGRKRYNKLKEKAVLQEEIDSQNVLFEINHFLSSFVGDQLSSIFFNNQIFIPAGRSFYANLQNNIFSFISSNNEIDPFLAEFGSYYENIKSSRLNLLKKTTPFDSIINPLIEKILLGSHIREKGEDFLLLQDGRKINLSNASSGQQEMLPLALMIRYLFYIKFVNRGATVYIEEPEAHLFPTAQRHIVELISTAFNLSESNLQFVITTHSPYILTSLNNLIQAGNVRAVIKEENAKKLFKLVPKAHILDSSVVNAYALADGLCSSIKDDETKLIGTSIIDKVSDDLAVQFDGLLDIE